MRGYAIIRTKNTSTIKAQKSYLGKVLSLMSKNDEDIFFFTIERAYLPGLILNEADNDGAGVV